MGRRAYPPKRYIPLLLLYVYYTKTYYRNTLSTKTTYREWFLCLLLFMHLKTDRPQPTAPPSLHVSIFEWRRAFPTTLPLPRSKREMEGFPDRTSHTLSHAEHETTCPLASFRGRHLFYTSPPHAEHKITPSLVLFCVWHLFFALPHILYMKPHPCWCDFVLGSFLAPRINFEGCLLNILYIIKLLLYIFNSIYTEPTGISTPVDAGREFGGYRCGAAKNAPRDTRVHLYL
jgi:hypothetical protein